MTAGKKYFIARAETRAHGLVSVCLYICLSVPFARDSYTSIAVLAQDIIDTVENLSYRIKSVAEDYRKVSGNWKMGSSVCCILAIPRGHLRIDRA